MKKSIFILMCFFLIGAVHAQKVVKPRGGVTGTWKVIGTTHATHTPTMTE